MFFVLIGVVLSQTPPQKSPKFPLPINNCQVWDEEKDQIRCCESDGYCCAYNWDYCVFKEKFLPIGQKFPELRWDKPVDNCMVWDEDKNQIRCCRSDGYCCAYIVEYCVAKNE